MAIFNSYVKLPEGNHHSSKALDIRCIMLGGSNSFSHRFAGFQRQCVACLFQHHFSLLINVPSRWHGSLGDFTAVCYADGGAEWAGGKVLGCPDKFAQTQEGCEATHKHLWPCQAWPGCFDSIWVSWFERMSWSSLLPFVSALLSTLGRGAACSDCR